MEEKAKMTYQKNQNKKVYLIGICGSGMSALAVLFKESGWQVTGSDEKAFEPTTTQLKNNKISFYKKYNAKNIEKDTDLVILGNNIPLSLDENPEKKVAVESNLVIKSMPEALATLAKEKENILVVGSSGKSTTTTLLAWCLYKAKKDPSYFIGALPLNFRNSSHIGKGSEFVIEGDEYTSSKTDPRSKFLHFNPSSVLLTSAEHDHINVFPTETSYKQTYKKLMAKIPQDGLLVYSLDAKNTKEIAKSAKSRIMSYALDNKKADYYAENIKYGMESSFDLMHKGKKVVTVKTKLLGKHNIENIIGAGALLLENKKMTPEIFSKAINSFHGIKNRIELKTKNSKVLAYSGFGSSYEKTKSIFNTLRLHFPNRRLITVFEPHAFSWRNRKFLKWYRNVFDNVEEVIMLPATGHGKVAKDQLTTTEVWSEAKKYKDIHTIQNEKEGLDIIKKIAKSGDVVALVSSGLLLGLSKSVPKLLDKKFSK